MRIVVECVDAPRHTVDLTTRGPFGITVRNHIVCTAVEDSRTRVAFGCAFDISPVWWSWVLERIGATMLYDGVANGLARLKHAAESG